MPFQYLDAVEEKPKNKKFEYLDSNKSKFQYLDEPVKKFEYLDEQKPIPESIVDLLTKIPQPRLTEVPTAPFSKEISRVEQAKEASFPPLTLQEQASRGKIPSFTYGIGAGVKKVATPENIAMMAGMGMAPAGILAKIANAGFGALMTKGVVENLLKGEFSKAIERKDYARAGEVLSEQVMGIAGAKVGFEGLKTPSRMPPGVPRIAPDEIKLEKGESMPAPLEKPISSIQSLTEAVSKVTSPKNPLSERMNLGENIAKTAIQTKDTLSNTFQTVKGHAATLWDAYSKPPEWTEFKDMLGEYLGGRQKAALESTKFAKSIQKAIPDPIRQEAITNYIQAGGDTALLQERANLTKDFRLKKGYEVATQLTESEKVLAQSIREYHDQILDKAIESGIIEDGVENYVKQQWKRENPFTKKVMAEINSGLLRKNPAFAKKRIFESYFEGEQKDGTPTDKRIGYQITGYNQAFEEAILARTYIKSMLEGKAKDGRPLVSVSGAGKQIKANEVTEGYLIRPKVNPEATGDYKEINHPALRKWKWVSSDPDGKPIFVEGNMTVHPEAYSHLKNALSKSAIRKYSVGRALLAGIREFKSTLLSLSGFHYVQEGVHAVGHKVNPFNLAEINLDNPDQMFLVNHGTMVFDHNALTEFSEGLHATGLINRLPGIGQYLQKSQEYLFQDFIPRLKMTMALDAFKRNTLRYSKVLSKDQIGELTSNQANAAFGELNYKMAGRNPTVQDALRIAFLAPDFLEARFRFAGQALKPYGKEQMAALIRVGAGLYVGARIINLMMSGNLRTDKPFSVIHEGREYTLRSVPGDIYHLIQNPRTFIYHRLNPTVSRTLIEALTGRDEFGRKRDAGQQVKDLFRIHAPIPIQGKFKDSEATLLDSILQSIGVSSFKSRHI